jgi:hypothetical protein
MKYNYSCFLLVFLLQGCAAGLLAASVGSVAVTETTGKSVTDHAVSTAKNKDCRLSRWLKNEQVCQTEIIVTIPAIIIPISNATSVADSYEEVLAKRIKNSK